MRALRYIVAGALTAVVAPGLRGQGAPAPGVGPGGHGTIYFAGYGQKILVIDEATFTVRDTIPVSVGIPWAQLSHNRKRLYATEPRNEKIEIIDIATKKSLAVISLSSDTLHAKLNVVGVDPKERFMLLGVRTWAKKRDRYEISTKPILVRYDLERRVVTDTIPWPKGEDNPYTSAIFPPAAI